MISVLFSQTMSNSDRLVLFYFKHFQVQESLSQHTSHIFGYFHFIGVPLIYFSTTCCTAGFREGGRCRQRRSCLGDLSTAAPFECHRGVFESDQETWPKCIKMRKNWVKWWSSFLLGMVKATESLAAKGWCGFKGHDWQLCCWNMDFQQKQSPAGMAKSNVKDWEWFKFWNSFCSIIFWFQQ